MTGTCPWTVARLVAALLELPQDYVVRVAWQHDARDVVGVVVPTEIQSRRSRRRVPREPRVYLEVTAILPEGRRG